MSDLPEITALQRLDVKPGEVLLVRLGRNPMTGDPMTAEVLEHVKAVFGLALPDVRVIVHNGDIANVVAIDPAALAEAVA